mgnify:CR=1 FL=1
MVRSEPKGKPQQRGPRAPSFAFSAAEPIRPKRPRGKGTRLPAPHQVNRAVPSNAVLTFLTFSLPRGGKRAWKGSKEGLPRNGATTGRVTLAELRLVLSSRANLPEERSDRE